MKWEPIPRGIVARLARNCRRLAIVVVALAALPGASPVARLAPVATLFGKVGIYQTDGLVEISGATLRQRAAGPVAVSETAVKLTDRQAVFKWTPEALPTAGANCLHLSFIERPTATVRIAFRLKSGSEFQFQLGEAPPDTDPPQTPLPEWADSNLDKTPESLVPLVWAGPLEAVADLPPAMLAELKAGGSEAVRDWDVLISGQPGETVRFAEVALADRAAGAAVQSVRVSGRVTGTPAPNENEIMLVEEDGQTRTARLSPEGRYVFDTVPTTLPISVRLRHRGEDFYTAYGRWFTAGRELSDADIDVRPRFENTDEHHPNATALKYTGAKQASSFANSYEPHTEIHWEGLSTLVQEFNATTFANNIGFVDRDRFPDNPDHCFRIVDFGSSLSVSIQIFPYQKYSMILESELGVKMRRCVEVISAGRDQGEIGVAYEQLKGLVAEFHPDLVLLEITEWGMLQIQPDLLRAQGWDPEYPPHGGFYRDNDGNLQFRPASAEYPFHASKPDDDARFEGIPLAQVFSVSADHLPAVAKDALRYAADILRFYKRQFPGTQFALYTGFDQGQCVRWQNCTHQEIYDGVTMNVGADAFVANITTVCQVAEVGCIHPHVDPGLGRPETLISFKYDSHYSVRGHQWLARELARGILALESAQ